MEVDPGSVDTGKLFMVLAAILGALGVMMGALGAHLFSAQMNEESESIFQTALEFHMYHALALIFTGWVQSRWKSVIMIWAGWFFLAGVILFSFSLYLVTLMDLPMFNVVTPVGGLCLVAGWSAVAWGVIKHEHLKGAYLQR